MMAAFLGGIFVGFVLYASFNFAFDRWLSRPSVPKWPRDYRKICDCMR